MQVFKNIANTFLAITLLVATTGITLNKHYCMGRLKSVAVNEHAAHCFAGEEEQMPCCKDVSQELKVEEITTADFDFDANPSLYELAIINFVIVNRDGISSDVDKSHFRHYSPPLPDAEFQIAHQVFLI